jgi:hypothetical protein
MLPHDEVFQLVILYTSLESCFREKSVENAFASAAVKAKTYGLR